MYVLTNDRSTKAHLHICLSVHVGGGGVICDYNWLTFINCNRIPCILILKKDLQEFNSYSGIVVFLKKAVARKTAIKPYNLEIVYRGNSLSVGINPKFPWIKYYIKYLLSKSSEKTVFEPIAFWYDHKKEFLEDCRCLDNSKRDRYGDLTLQIEKDKALKSQQKTKLKYRGVTYYR